MSKFEQLKEAIDAIPAEYRRIWSTMTRLLDGGQLSTLSTYTKRTRTMALHLTSDEALLKPLTTIQELLK